MKYRLPPFKSKRPERGEYDRLRKNEPSSIIKNMVRPELPPMPTTDPLGSILGPPESEKKEEDHEKIQ